jgi:fatty acid desaturase
MTAWQEALSPEERKSLLAFHDGWSWLSFLVDWGLIALSFAAVARFPNPLTVVVALFVIGARQLGLAVLMHEAAHRTLFRNRRLNDFVGNWLCAYPIWNDVVPYRGYHLQHHAKTGTVEDPDLGLATPFPITKASLRRKIWRDLSGQTGWKRAKATFRRDIGKSHGRARRLDWGGVRNFQGVVVTNLVLLGILTLAGRPALYLLWVVAWFTTYSLVMRIRSIAEHAMVPDQGDELRNTRTTIIAWWERLLIGPNYVNYHLEHHILMTVPHYNLPRMHRLLRERGALDADCVTDGYLQVLAVAASLPG